MRTAYEPLFCLSHGDQRVTEWKSCDSFTHCILVPWGLREALQGSKGDSQVEALRPRKKTCQTTG